MLFYSNILLFFKVYFLKVCLNFGGSKQIQLRSDQENSIMGKSLHSINSAPSNSKTKVTLMSGSCHLDRALNVEIGFEC